MTQGMVDLNLLGSHVKTRLGDANRATIQAARLIGTWATAVLTVQRSNDGVTWAALESGVTFAAAGISVEIDADGYEWLRAIVTTAEGSGSDALATVTINTKRVG